MKKPLGIKSYGSIPHLPGSRLGGGDHHISEGEAQMLTRRGSKCHDWWNHHDGTVIVTEKVDGSCMSIAKVDGLIVTLGRAGHRAESSRFEQHKMFADWVMREPDRFHPLCDRERVAGEWLSQAHGTRYEIYNNPFIAFDIFDEFNTRAPYLMFLEMCQRMLLPTARLIHIGGPISIKEVRKKLEPSGHGAIDPVEGAVWKLEEEGHFLFNAKWVRPDKEDGKYLPEVSGKEAIWNWRPL